MDKLQRARTILAAQYDSIKFDALATAVLLGKYDNKPEMKAVLAALNEPAAAPVFVTDGDPTWRPGVKAYTVTVSDGSMQIMVMDGARIEFIGEAKPCMASIPAAPVDDGMLPDALVPYSKEWYTLCERRFAVDKIKISGDLACAIVDAICARPTSTPPAPGIDLRVRELLARRLRQWRTHLPADPAKPGIRAIRTYDHPGLEGETDYNNDVAIWREACSVLDEALTLIDASSNGGHCTTCTCDPNMTPAIRFDLSPAMVEGEVRNHLIALGWTPPDSPSSTHQS